MNDINIEVSKAYYIGEKYSKLLEKLDILTLKDLVYYYPIKYEDSRNVINIEDIIIDNKNIVKGKIIKIKSIYTKDRLNIINADIEDQTGIAKIIWFNQPFITNNIYQGVEIIISGIASFEKGYPLFKSPQYDIICIYSISSNPNLFFAFDISSKFSGKCNFLKAVLISSRSYFSLISYGI